LIPATLLDGVSRPRASSNEVRILSAHEARVSSNQPMANGWGRSGLCWRRPASAGRGPGPEVERRRPRAMSAVSPARPAALSECRLGDGRAEQREEPADGLAAPGNGRGSETALAAAAEGRLL